MNEKTGWSASLLDNVLPMEGKKYLEPTDHPDGAVGVVAAVRVPCAGAGLLLLLVIYCRFSAGTKSTWRRLSGAAAAGWLENSI